MESMISDLVSRFEKGSLSRRELVERFHETNRIERSKSNPRTSS